MIHKIQVKILSKLIGDKIPLPTYSTPGSAAVDLRACITESIILKYNLFILYKFIQLSIKTKLEKNH